MPYRRVYRKKRVPRKAYRKRRALRKSKNVPDKASCSVSLNIGATQTNVAYNYETFRLSDSARATAIARGYQRYRIVNIRLTWKPLYDTYVPGGVGGATKPVLYYMIDKSRSIQDTFNIAQLKEMGARPRRFDERPIQVNWRPGVLMDADTGGPTPSQYVRIAPYLSTNQNTDVPGAGWAVSQVNHGGIKWFMESADGQATPIQVTVEYQIEFTKPNWSTAAGAEQAQGLTFA